ncbi:hypothetical protein [Lutimonas zeaxanthinifaciens]|uniref:hypothetical protein n=1 Tax=Lutimonas zeaxanthinifaciens TaxID=3060215 RepID=UPI00265D0F53|nr:hypothetical protein [Lutimonas sp. YSD2104]WKK67055.1 hypothetical protein QZH61_05385 [Lutimonas sp. YSD2104]
MERKLHKGWFILKIFLAFMIFFLGVLHFIIPNFYLKVIPPFLMNFAMPIIYISGIIEIVIGLLLFTKKYQYLGALSLFLLMLAFLPLHIWDVFAENPFTGSRNAAYIRLAIQFVLIALPWKLKSIYRD